MKPAALRSLQPDIVRNLIAVYRTATYANVLDGKTWYPNARSIVAQWSKHYQRDARTVAAVVAVISPQCPWESNIIVADDLLAGRLPSVYGVLNANLAKAYQILRDNAVDVAPYLKTGWKVRAFAQNLAGCDTAVTVDTHAIQAALGNPLLDGSSWFRQPVYGIIAECYRLAARKVRKQPAEFQAIVWCAWKTRYPASRKRWLKKTANELPPSVR